MPSLSPEKRRSRRSFDYEVLSAMLPHSSASMKAYGSPEDAKRGRILSHEHGLLGLAEVYDITYTFAIKVSANRTVPAATARFVLNAGSNYPYSEPSAQFIDVIPWLPHVFSNGIVCLGESWKQAGGKMLLAQLVVHVAHLLNFDEPDAGRDYEANNEALEFWREELDSRPLHPTLEYPSLPSHLTHGLPIAKPSVFRVVSEDASPPPRMGFRLLAGEE